MRDWYPYVNYLDSLVSLGLGSPGFLGQDSPRFLGFDFHFIMIIFFHSLFLSPLQLVIGAIHIKYSFCIGDICKCTHPH